MLDPKTENSVARIAEEVRRVFGPDLVSLTLYGSAAGDDFVAGRSDLNFAIVVERLTFEHLKTLHRHLPKWHKLGAATPLLLDRHFLDRARDVFPMELQDIKAEHRVLFGEQVFATLPIDQHHLRYQSEHEARGKLLRLRVLYAEVGARHKDLQALMLDSVKTFLIIMRSLVRLRVGDAVTPFLRILDQFEDHFDVTFPAMRHLIRVKLGMDRWAEDLEDAFQSYLHEVERLVDLIDRIPPEPAAPND